MAEPVSLQTLLTYLTLISVPVGVFYHIMTLRNTRKNQELQLETRQAQLFMNLYENYRSAEFRKQWYTFVWLHEWKDYDDYWEKYGPGTNIDAITAHGALMGFYEGIGFLLKRELIDVSYVDDLLRHSILMVWEKYEPLLKESRGVLNRSVYENFEYLVNELKHYIEEHPELKT